MYMIKDVICSNFEKQIGRFQGRFGSDGKPTERKALLIYFRINRETIKMLIHAPDNYVGVYIQKEGEKKWGCIGYHDSGWRESIHNFLFKNREVIHFDTLRGLKGEDFITGTKLTEDELKILKQARKKKYD